jgi:putative chitinase
MVYANDQEFTPINQRDIMSHQSMENEMSLIDIGQLKRICIGKPNQAQTANMASFILSVNQFGAEFGLDKPYNLSSFLGQVMVESGGFKYDRELWGPSPAQKKYEGRKDLGNIQKGDGSKFRGYGPIQLTGRGNVTKFYKWALKNYAAYGAPVPPDFTKHPEKIISDPWEGLSALWYWGYGNPEGVSLNKYSEDNNQLMVTKRVNGGTTHYAERLEYQTRAALVLLGYGVSKAGILKFQMEHQPAAGNPDGIVGDRTRDALHIAMKGSLPVTSEKTIVVESQVPVPVKVENLDKPWYKDIDGIAQVGGGTVMTTVVSFLTNADVTKILAIAALAAGGFGVWYFIRRSKAKAQNVAVARIEQSATSQTITETVRTV